MHTSAYGTFNPSRPLEPLMIERRAVGPKDVRISIDYCGVCHSDIHMARNDWGVSLYPLVPGHEIIGRVVSLGSEVHDFQIGERVGVGCMVDACRRCDACHNHLEQFCEQMVMTYGSADAHRPGEPTYGGYSSHIVIERDFVLHIPESLDPASAAPLLCAGITTYSPLRHWKIESGHRVGVIGLGGLGHMGIKFAVAMGAHVTMITHSPQKEEDAKRLGAHDVLIAHNSDQMKQYTNCFNFLLNTIPVAHDASPYIPLLKQEGVMVVVGITPIQVQGLPLVFGRKSIAGSLIGGILETQEMLHFCAQHGITADVEMIAMHDIHRAYDRMMQSDVKYRFVIDMHSLHG